VSATNLTKDEKDLQDRCPHSANDIEVRGVRGLNYVHCWHCGLEGPLVQGEENARTAWEEFIHTSRKSTQ
jgi:hypothetical protein